MLNNGVVITPSLARVGNVFYNVANSSAIEKDLRRYAYQTEAESKRLLSGELVNVQTGLLRASTGVTRISGLSATISSRTPYAVFVHEGTRKMGARPYLKFGLERATIRLFGNESPFESSIITEFEKEFRKL